MAPGDSPERDAIRHTMAEVKAASERKRRLREEMKPLLDQIEDPRDPIFDQLPDRLEDCETGRESILHRQRAALTMRERYSEVPFHAERAERRGFDYWLDLSGSAVNILPGPAKGSGAQGDEPSPSASRPDLTREELLRKIKGPKGQR